MRWVKTPRGMREHNQTHTHTVLPYAVILSLKVVVYTIDQIAEEASINGFSKLVSVLFWHLYSVTPSDHVTWKTNKHKR